MRSGSISMEKDQNNAELGSAMNPEPSGENIEAPQAQAPVMEEPQEIRSERVGRGEPEEGHDKENGNEQDPKEITAELVRQVGVCEETPHTTDGSKKINYTKRKLCTMCDMLSSETRSFKPEVMVEEIRKYVGKKERVDRLLYSAISYYVLELDEQTRGNFATNIESLLQYYLDDKNKVHVDYRKIIIKIYDHFQLVLYQIENVKEIVDKGISETKDKLDKDMKGMEKDYISILGIFSSVVLAFVGGMAFSTSVLENINAVSIYRLILTVDLLGFVLVNTIYLMLKFILVINDKDFADFQITDKKYADVYVRKINMVLMWIAIIVIAAWALRMRSFPDWYSLWLPWTK